MKTVDTTSQRIEQIGTQAKICKSVKSFTHVHKTPTTQIAVNCDYSEILCW